MCGRLRVPSGGGRAQRLRPSRSGGAPPANPKMPNCSAFLCEVSAFLCECGVGFILPDDTVDVAEELLGLGVAAGRETDCCASAPLEADAAGCGVSSVRGVLCSWPLGGGELMRVQQMNGALVDGWGEGAGSVDSSVGS